MSERPSVLDLARAAESALDRNRARIDDLNVYPVPDGDTGTNMLLTVRAVREALEAGKTDIAHAAFLAFTTTFGPIAGCLVGVVFTAIVTFAIYWAMGLPLRREVKTT